MRVEILTANGPVVIDGSRVVVRAAARQQSPQQPLTPIAVAVESQPGLVIAAAAGDPQFQEILRALRITDTILVTTPMLTPGGIHVS